MPVRRRSALDALDALAAMRLQEEEIACYNYFAATACDKKNGIDASCRASMIEWLTVIQTQLRLDVDTVWVAASYLDRYASSGRGNSRAALEDKYQYQLAFVAAFYLAVKLHEKDVELPVSLLVKICRGYYPEQDILSMEEDILFALDWRMNVPAPTDFVVRFADLLPATVDESAKQSLVEAARRHVGRTAADVYFAFCKPSVVGAGCLASALAEAEGTPAGPTKSERQAFWLELGRVADLIDVMEAQAKLLDRRPPRRVSDDSNAENRAPQTPSPEEQSLALTAQPQQRPSVIKITKRLGSSLLSKASSAKAPRRPSLTDSGHYSPVCVTQVPPQA